MVYVSAQRRLGQPRTNWGRGLLQQAAVTRNRCVAHMLFDMIAMCDARDTCPTQKLPLISSKWDHEEANIVFRKSSQRGGILTSWKKTDIIIMHFSFVRVCQLLSTRYVPRVSYCRAGPYTLPCYSLGVTTYDVMEVWNILGSILRDTAQKWV